MEARQSKKRSTDPDVLAGLNRRIGCLLAPEYAKLQKGGYIYGRMAENLLKSERRGKSIKNDSVLVVINNEIHTQRRAPTCPFFFMFSDCTMTTNLCLYFCLVCVLSLAQRSSTERLCVDAPTKEGHVCKWWIDLEQTIPAAVATKKYTCTSAEWSWEQRPGF